MSLLDEMPATESKSKEVLCNKGISDINLENGVIKLPYALNKKITEILRFGDDYSNLKKILIEKENTDSLFSTSFSCSSDFCASFCKAREIAVYGDYSLLKLRISLSDNVYFFISNVYPSMLMTIQLCKTYLTFAEEGEMERPQFVSSNGREPEFYEIMESLGQYARGTIKICPQRLKEAIDSINKFDKDIKIELEDLFIIVYLHELAHAMLDSKCEIKVIQNDLNNPNNFKYESSYIGDNNGKFDIASLAMEESLANMIMLKYIKKYAEMNPTDSYLFEIAKYFVRQQCGIYSFGYHQFCLDADWTKWRDYKIYHPESNDPLNGWFNRCFHDGNIIITLEDYTNEIFNNVFV